jgi:hypothetical protein
VELDSSGVHVPHHRHDFVDLIGVGEELRRHVPTGRVRELAVLQMKARPRKQIEIADVVVMQVREDHVLGGRGIHAEQAQTVRR